MRHMKWTSFLLAAVVLSACGSPQKATGGAAATGNKPSCDELATACHGRDGVATQECHDLAHSPATNEECAENRTECLRECYRAPAEAE